MQLQGKNEADFYKKAMGDGFSCYALLSEGKLCVR
ncbi:hypothetical protein ACOMICROBIO_EPCKBFOG_02599 [Vibrio sp. B1FLJ16]|nr:hypothetical protein ACOMICROBIO_EPCKBFOG_02599 [Vibrio sp. B1FLJ16]CAE6920219.1 hypothetical protein ACOMICROBIO_EPCKBFOG_02599 [Vibrio sp. B1FLJ16]